MKALKSELAKRVLADPTASGQLRYFLAQKNALRSGSANAPSNVGTASAQPAGAPLIEVRFDRGPTRRFRPVVVPKAA
ncbi:MAG: hypothetical protein JWP52_2095 [Rhizobacter sp.]|nr:hypothetical protein [Rhizobacter sp.]